ncbi:MAG: glutathione S-transferase [Acidobacteriota bacterium]
MPDLKVFSYLPNPRLYKATIAARFSGAEIEIVGAKPPELRNWLWDFDARELDDGDKAELVHFERTAAVGFSGSLFKTDAFLEAHPFGAVPAGFSGDGSVGIFESNSILRAAARCGTKEHGLLGEGPMEQSRVDSFLDRSLGFAKETQRYLLAASRVTEELHAEMAKELDAYGRGMDMALTHSSHLVGDRVTLADIALACELCLLTNESRFVERLDELGVGLLLPGLRQYERLGAHLRALAADERFNEDLGKYFGRLLAVWA